MGEAMAESAELRDRVTTAETKLQDHLDCHDQDRETTKEILKEIKGLGEGMVRLTTQMETADGKMDGIHQRLDTLNGSVARKAEAKDLEPLKDLPTAVAKVKTELKWVILIGGFLLTGISSWVIYHLK